MRYWLKVVFADGKELALQDVEKHFISDDLEVLEITAEKELIIVPMRQIKYISCDGAIFKK